MKYIGRWNHKTYKPNNLIDSLEALQLRAAIYVQNKFLREDSVTEMIQSLGWDSLEARQVKQSIILLFKRLLSYEAIELWDCWVMSLLSYEAVELWGCWVMRLLSYEAIELWGYWVMRLLSYEAIELWGYWVMRLLSYEAVELWRRLSIEQTEKINPFFCKTKRKKKFNNHNKSEVSKTTQLRM